MYALEEKVALVICDYSNWISHWIMNSKMKIISLFN